jgi:hypothetical protein
LFAEPRLITVAEARAGLPFSDKRDFDEQKKGLIAPMQDPYEADLHASRSRNRHNAAGDKSGMSAWGQQPKYSP